MKPIFDAVYTWVNGNDPKHVEKRLQHYRELKIPGTLPQAASDTRYSDCGELWYSINLARKHAPWLGTIFLLTDDQKPSWLDDPTQGKLGITLIDHREIFRGYEEYLPTFNSNSIEAMLHRIPNLSPSFIYFNDDCFIIRPVEPHDYFLNGMNMARGFWTWKNRYFAYLERKMRIYLFHTQGLHALVGKRAESILLPHYRYFRLAHTPHSLQVQKFIKCFQDDNLLRNAIQYRFRNDRQIWPIGYILNLALRSGQAIQHPPDWEYLSPHLSFDRLTSVFDAIKKNFHIKHLCIQSLDKFTPNAYELCIDFLSSLL